MDVLKKGQKCRKVEENLNTIESYFIYVLKIEYGWNQVAKSSPYFWLYVLWSKVSGRFRKIFVAFSEYMNFMYYVRVTTPKPLR